MILSDSFKAELIHLTPILASLLFGMLCAFLLSTSSIELYRTTILPEENVGPLLNASYFVVLAGSGAFLLYSLLKRKSLRLIRLITGIALTAAVFMLSFTYLFAVFSRFPIPNIETFILASSIAITIILISVVLGFQSRISDLVIVGLGGGLGTFLGASIPTLSAILILCFLAVYDTFAVYYGPVGKIALNGLEQFSGLSFSFKNIHMGLGDLVFYSMLSGHLFLNFGLFSGVAAIIGILVGCLLVFKMLERKRMFPGLPFPILLGLMAGLTHSLLTMPYLI